MIGSQEVVLVDDGMEHPDRGMLVPRAGSHGPVVVDEEAAAEGWDAADAEVSRGTATWPAYAGTSYEGAGGDWPQVPAPSTTMLDKCRPSPEAGPAGGPLSRTRGGPMSRRKRVAGPVEEP